MHHSSDGEHAFDSGIQELEQAGYLHRTRTYEEGSTRFNGWDWHWFEVPISAEEFKKCFRNGGFPDIGKIPISGKPGPNKNECPKKDEKDNNRARESRSTKSVVVSSLKPVASGSSLAKPAQGCDTEAQVVIFPCLNELKISEAQKRSVSAKLDAAQADTLVKRVMAWNGRQNDSVAVSTILDRWDDWDDGPTQSEEERIEENRAAAQQAQRSYTSYSDTPTVHFEVNHTYAELWADGGHPVIIDYSEKHFKELLKIAMLKFKYTKPLKAEN
jgi:hypothetical protein